MNEVRKPLHNSLGQEGGPPRDSPYPESGQYAAHIPPVFTDRAGSPGASG